MTTEAPSAGKRLAKLRLRNFQAHRDTTLDLSADITVLVGPNDAGKSCVWRALYWLATNRPTGSGLQSTWDGVTSVKLELADGTTVTRRKSGRDNSYTVNGREYKGFGTDVPEVVTRALGWSVDLSFQSQDDGPFLLSLSPAARAETLSHLYGIADADRIMANLESVRRSLTSAIRAESAKIEQEEPELESRATALQDVKSSLEAIRILHTSLETEEDTLGALRADVGSLKRYRGQVSSLTGARGPLSEAVELWEPVSRESELTDRLQEWVGEARRAGARMTECGEAIPLIKVAVIAWDEYQQVALELEDLQVLVSQGRKAEEARKVCQQGKMSTEAAIRELDLSVCPVCGQAVESADVFLVAAGTGGKKG